MAERGDSYFNPVTGTRMVFATVPADNGGRELAIDWYVPPGERLAAARHYHAGPDGLVVERFEIIEGSAECTIGPLSHAAEAPAAFDIPCNTVHVHPRNAGSGMLLVRQRVFLPAPDLETLTRVERFFETLTALSQQRKADRNGDIADPLQAALTIHATLIDPTYLPGMPRVAQRGLLGAVAAAARMLGYRAHIMPEKEATPDRRHPHSAAR